MPDIVYPIEFGIPRVSLFSALCFVCASAVSVALVGLGIFMRHLYMRLAVVMAALLHMFFQWPLFLVSNAVEASLDNKYSYFLAVQLSIIFLLVFATLTSRVFRSNRSGVVADIPGSAILTPVGIGLLLVSIYLASVPFDCTALYAVLFDPGVALLAREVSIKLAGSYIGAVSYGAITNAVAPVVVALSLAGIWNAISNRSWWRVGGYLCVIFGAVTASLLSGAKGLLLPTLIVVLVVSIEWSKTNAAKVASLLASVALLMGVLVIFEVVRDRTVERPGRYEFGKCVVRLEACKVAEQLVQSLYERSGSLGVSDDRRGLLKDDLQAACVREAGRVIKEQSVDHSSVGGGVASRSQTNQAKNGEIVSGSGLSLAQSIESYSRGILYRAFVTSVQVGAWHYLYVSEVGSPGIRGISWLRKSLGEPSVINMPELVYQAYGSKFSGGDKTSTSTAPTTFLVAYPAYLGVGGFVLALFLVLVTDLIAAALMARVSASILPICFGLIVAVVFNLLLSDFPTVMTTHGGIASLALLAVFGKREDRV